MKAYVIPALEEDSPHFIYPKYKKEVIDLLQNNQVRQFDRDKYRPSHAPTNLRKWKQKDAPYHVKYAHGYEPYIVVKKAVCPRYSQNFMGRYYNKIQHILEIFAARFLFMVLPDVWTIHYSHPYNRTSAHKPCSQAAMEHFKKLLNHKYRGKFTYV